MPNPSNRRGFTLIELMIAVAIVGILSAVALPNYKRHVRTAQRANAQGVMVDCAQKFERQYAGSMSYAGITVANSGGSGTCVMTVTGIATSGGSIYSMAVTPTATTYTLLATPSTDQANDSCQSLCVDNTGAKLAGAASGSGSTCAALIPSPVSGCW